MISFLTRGVQFSKCFGRVQQPFRCASSSFYHKPSISNSICRSKFRSYVTKATSQQSSSSSHTTWAIVSALIFIPAFFYVTRPPASHYENRAAKASIQPEEPPSKVSIIENLPPDAFTYVLVGGGTASYNALQGIKEVDPNAEVLIITEEDYPPYERPPLSKELWFANDPEAHKNLSFTNWQGKHTRVFYMDESEYGVAKPGDLPTGRPSVRLMKNTTAVELRPDENSLILSSGDKIQYKKLFLGLGGTPKWYPGAPGNQKNIMTFRTIHDLQQLWEQLAPNKRVAVLGGGFLGSELAVAMTNKCKVTQYFPESGLLARVLPSYLSKYITKQLSSDSLEIVPDTKVQKLTPSVNNQVIVHLNHTTRPFDVVLVAIGIEPNVKLAKSGRLETDPKNQGIVVNSQFQAAHNIWCAGDNVSFYDPLFTSRRRVEHYDHAAVSGFAAGKAMAGKASFQPPQSMFWSTLGPDISVEAIGLVDAELQTIGVWSDREENTKKGVIFYSQNNKIVGTLLFNMPGQIDKARDILKEGHPFSKSNDLAKRFNLYDAIEETS